VGLPVQPAGDFVDAQQRARARLAEIQREKEERARERREGRKHGELSRSLEEKIEACNPKQLKRVIKLARQNLKDHKQAPERWQIHLYGNTQLLAHASHKNKLYCLELRSCGKPKLPEVSTRTLCLFVPQGRPILPCQVGVKLLAPSKTNPRPIRPDSRANEGESRKAGVISTNRSLTFVPPASVVCKPRSRT
jgi:hypothetical protein